MMARIYLINVGANRSHENRARGPIFPDGTWIFVPFPREKATQKGQRFPEMTLPYVDVPDGSKCHLDPDWDGLTYGDCCDNPRAKSLLKVKKGDILLFWALLWKTDRGSAIFDRHDRGWYLIGALRVEHILKDGERIDSLPLDIQQRVGFNAHIDEGKVKERVGERVFVGSSDLRHTRRFATAVDWEVYHDGGLMHRVVRTADGKQVRWNESPRWNSVTRSCRAILDLDDERDRGVASFLESRIGEKNEGFDLIDGA
jgi:hypothetical protein